MSLLSTAQVCATCVECNNRNECDNLFYLRPSWKPASAAGVNVVK